MIQPLKPAVLTDEAKASNLAEIADELDYLIHKLHKVYNDAFMAPELKDGHIHSYLCKMLAITHLVSWRKDA